MLDNFMKYLCFFFLISIILAVLVIPLFYDYDIYQISLSQSLHAPSWSHIFGLDENGKDLFIQTIYGARISLFICFTVVSLSLLLGLVLGILAAYLEGWVEIVIMSIVDLVLAFPKFLMALALIAIFGGSVFNLIFALSFSTWAGFARLVRGEVKYLKKKEFVLQAISEGASDMFLIVKHIIPNIVHLIFVYSIFQIVAVLTAESGLSFLGLGAGSQTASWGALLGSGREYLFSAPHVIFFPSVSLFIFLLSLNYLAGFLKSHFEIQSI